MFFIQLHLHMKVSSFLCVNAESSCLISGRVCFPFTHSVNPSTSLNITCQQSHCVPVAASLSILMSHGGFFRLVGRNDALHGHMLDLFSVVFEQVTAGFSY